MAVLSFLVLSLLLSLARALPFDLAALSRSLVPPSTPSPLSLSLPSFTSSATPLHRRWSLWGCEHDRHHIFTCKTDENAGPAQHGIEPALLQRMARYSTFANLAYCGSNTARLPHVANASRPMACWTDETCIDDRGPPRGPTCPVAADVHAAFEGPESNGDNRMFVARPADDPNEVVVSFRGTKKSWANRLEDLNIARTDLPLCYDCSAHRGYWHAYDGELRDQVKMALVPLVRNGTRVVMTGHSMGGAHATLAAFDFQQRFPEWNIEMFTYGTPRIANRAFAAHITKNFAGRIFRVTAKNDPIPRLPPAALGYFHPAPEYFVDGDSGNPTLENVTVLGGYYNEEGNSGDNFWDGAVGKSDMDGDGDDDSRMHWFHSRYFRTFFPPAQA